MSDDREWDRVRSLSREELHAKLRRLNARDAILWEELSWNETERQLLSRWHDSQALERIFGPDTAAWAAVEEALGGREVAGAYRDELLEKIALWVDDFVRGRPLSDGLTAERRARFKNVEALAKRLAAEIEAGEADGNSLAELGDGGPKEEFLISRSGQHALLNLARGARESSLGPVRKNRPRNYRYQLWAVIAEVYERATGHPAATSKPWEYGEPFGPFVRLVKAISEALGTPNLTGHMVDTFLKTGRPRVRHERAQEEQAQAEWEDWLATLAHFLKTRGRNASP
jgi:hypothetical protein